MFALQHRFYGCQANMSTCPFSSFEDMPVNESLRHLSSHQALADIAAFHKFASKEFGLTEKNKWTTFGGSYPGMLAAWSRLSYPHLFHASVASSAPVRAKQVAHISIDESLLVALSMSS